MKINKAQPSHWLWLLLFFGQSLLGLILRALGKRNDSQAIVLYGHKLNGNLLALHRAMLAEHEGESFRPVFLSMDRDYCKQLIAGGIDARWACGFACAELLAKSSALISDHGLHSMQPFVEAYRYHGMRFFDVWHGIPFKGFDADDFRLQHGYDETWVASDLCRRLYTEQFGFDPSRVVATGYPRTDQLVQPAADTRALRAALGLPVYGRLILFAPTWAQDAAGRNLYPFGCEDDTFLDALATVARRHGAGVILRTHLNSGNVTWHGHANVHALPGSYYPDAEAILLASDILVCDWSSIAFDFLLLGRPTFFLDVEAPFQKGFSLGPEYRFGEVVSGLQVLADALDRALAEPDTYWRAHGTRHARVRHEVYGTLADGRAAVRCLARLRSALA